jgi:hypothetical protein
LDDDELLEEEKEVIVLTGIDANPIRNGTKFLASVLLPNSIFAAFLTSCSGFAKLEDEELEEELDDDEELVEDEEELDELEEMEDELDELEEVAEEELGSSYFSYGFHPNISIYQAVTASSLAFAADHAAACLVVG